MPRTTPRATPRQVALLEGKLVELRQSNAQLESDRDREQVQVRALKTRLGRQQRALERRSGTEGGAADVEYLHNVMLRWFTLHPSERPKLFPVVAALCHFTETDVAAINVRRPRAQPDAPRTRTRIACSTPGCSATP